MKAWQKWSAAAVVAAGVSWGVGALFDIHVSDTAALRAPGMSSDRLQIVQEAPTWFGKAVLFEDMERGTFGVAQLRRTLGLFWRIGGASFDFELKPGQPFRTVGHASRNARGSQQFAIGVKVEPPIQTIVIGSEAPDAGYVNDQDDLTWERVQSLPRVYQTATVRNGYAFLVVDEFTAAAYTFRAFDASGKLVADQLYAHSPRWVR